MDETGQGHMIRDIFDFNRRCLNVEAKTVPFCEKKHVDFNIKAINEETGELHREHYASDKHGTVTAIEYADPQSEEARWQTVRSVDALIDSAYFAIGGLVRAGLTVDQAIACFVAVHTANMTKKLGVVASRGDMGVADAVKPAGWTGPEDTMYEVLFGQKPLHVRAAAIEQDEVDPNPGGD